MPAHKKNLGIIIGIAILALSTSLMAQNSAFTYQGRLLNNGVPANGTHDFSFLAFDAATGGIPVGQPVTNTGVAVSNGLFTTAPDLGAAVFDGTPRWLAISVRTNSGGSFTMLGGRQVITATPYALSARSLSGTVAASQLPASVARLDVTQNFTTTPTFSGVLTPFNVGSSNKVEKLNSDLLDGLDSSAFWKTTGNADTVPGTHFIGTTDAQALVLRVGNQTGLRIEPSGSIAPNIVGGAAENSVENSSAVTIGGGNLNSVKAGSENAVIGGGYFNSINSNSVNATISGGRGNFIHPWASSATIGGGLENKIQTNAYNTMIGGGKQNTVMSDAQSAVINGGIANTIGTNSTASTIGGGAQNQILGGTRNAVIGGGALNTIAGFSESSTVGGGVQNSIQGGSVFAAIQGGSQNTIGMNAPGSSIGGGWNNLIRTNMIYSVIAGGYNNTIGGALATILGGEQNQITDGTHSVILGGYHNTVNGNRSLAAGQQAAAMHDNTFVWADGHGPFTSTGPDQFLIRATGGVGIGVTTPSASLDVGGDTQIRGLLRSGSETGTTEAPAPAGLVVRRINSIQFVNNTVVARTDNLTLERDGTVGGFIIRYPASPGQVTIACMGMNSSGTPVNFYTTLANPGTAGTVQIYSVAQSVVHFQCTFGITFTQSRHLTQVTLSRFGNDSYWSGTLSSTFNQ